MKSLLSEEQIRTAVGRLADDLIALYGNRPLVVVGVLTGSLVFLADLIRRLPMPLRIALVQASSYRGKATVAGQLTLQLDGLPDLKGRDVLLLDDIFDTGHTLANLVDQLKLQQPRSLQTVVLLRKVGRQEVPLVPDHIGFEIPNEFVVGYGLDWDDHFRNLPYIAALEESDLQAGLPM